MTISRKILQLPFCCADVESYQPRPLDYDAKFSDYMLWANRLPTAEIIQENFPPDDTKAILA